MCVCVCVRVCVCVCVCVCVREFILKPRSINILAIHGFLAKLVCYHPTRRSTNIYIYIYIYIYVCVCVCMCVLLLFRFYGISSTVGYLMSNPVYTDIYVIYIILNRIFIR